MLLLIVYRAYGASERTTFTYILLTFSSWFLAISWLWAPYIFNPSGFEWQKWVLHESAFLLSYLILFTFCLLLLLVVFSAYNFLPSPRTVTDFEDWTNWLFHKGGIGDEGKKSWEVWWLDEQSHIQTPRGRFWEIILSLRFFLIQYGVVYALNVVGHDRNFRVSSLSSILLSSSSFEAFSYLIIFDVCWNLVEFDRTPRWCVQ